MGSEEPAIPASDRHLLAQGAEARVWECVFLQRPAIIKQRFRKQYRHPDLDAKLTVTRLKQEVRAMLRARTLGVATPIVWHVDLPSHSIFMERIAGHSIKHMIFDGALQGDVLHTTLAAVGRAVATLHDAGIVHGDLTTSNMLLREDTLQLVMIDFGLSYNSNIPEDKAVDLYVLERAFLSTHAQHPGLFDHVLTTYEQASKHAKATLNRFAEVRLRGRKRVMIG